MSFLLDISIRALALGLAGALIDLPLRRAGAHVRHAVWFSVAAGMLTLPLLALFLPPWPVTIAAWKAPPPVEISIDLSGAAAPASAPAPAPVHIDWPPVIYCAGLLLLLARIARGALRLRAIVAGAKRESAPLALDLAPWLGIDPATVDIRSSARIGVPFTAGVRWPIILLPAGWREWPQSKLASVLAHELAHVARRDWLAARLASLNRAIFWFHPLAWWLERKLASLAEESADQTALAVVGDRKSYAGAIIDFALVMQGKRLRSMEATAMARSTKVGRRVERILATTHFSTATLKRGAALAIILCALPLVFAAASLTPEPQAAPPPPPPPPARLFPSGQADIQMTEGDVARMEAQLRSNPLDADTRMKLLFHYSKGNNAEATARHAAFLVENQPELSGAVIATQMLAGMLNLGMIDPQRSESELQRLAAIWKRHASERGNNAAVLANAAQILQLARDHFDAEDCLQRARKLEPSNPRYLRQLAALYAGALLNPRPSEPFLTKVKTELDTTPDAGLLLAVGEILAPGATPSYVKTPEQQRQYVESTKRRAVMAEQYLKRAQSFGADSARVQQAFDRMAAAGSMKPEVNPDPPKRITVGGRVQERMLVEQVAPKYPPLAKQARISGTVRFTALIGKDGYVESLTLVSGHPLLVGAAKEAVERWRYKPTLLNGEPVEVVTQIDVNFTLQGEPPPGNIAGEVGGVLVGVAGGVVGGVPGGAYRIGGGVTAPVPEYKVEPHYSQEARDARLEGTVLLAVVIDPAGRPQDVRVLRPLGLGLDEKAVEAVSQWRFKPGMKEGQPVPVQANIEINFRIGER